ncbi:allosteric substrate binding domain-containing protein, partial [Coniella lustricola]
PLLQSTPHLGASTVEAQENVSLDVCNQVIEILRGGMPTAAVNAPLILPEEYRKLQPFVRLVERMGDLYTQHFVGGSSSSSGSGGGGGMIGARSKFELVYHGELASVSNTRPLLAALVKGLMSSVSESGGRDVNIVNAQLIAKEKGIAINETHAREEAENAGYASLVTLRSLDGEHEHVIEGYVSGQSIYISKLGRFRANFVPEGTMVLLHNYDEPGKIGNVGIVLGSHGVNITFMQVASLDRGVGGVRGATQDAGHKGENEALMILGVDGDVTEEVLEALRRSEGILDVKLVKM